MRCEGDFVVWLVKGDDMNFLLSTCFVVFVIDSHVWRCSRHAKEFALRDPDVFVGNLYLYYWIKST